ncbi:MULTISPECIES: carbohydrate ABC transporter permease [Exiguobacterium]|uniref:carbohydrate ABC transporter permease n=1 Tax=Exiguobacterium TaxID=33986 RepID=UPI001BE66AF6|nr:MULTISPECIES: carbohydrate ABC transporter permease [Exiguobacterium]MCT4792740.1 carbohydrate ABC transporter permease [Exiguobacterium artemiae]
MNKQTIRGGIVFVFLCIVSLIILLPLGWMVSTALKPMEEILRYPPTFFPENWRFDNILATWKAAPFGLYLVNTLFLTVVSVLASVLINAFVAYGFAKINFPGRSFWFIALLATMMIPGFVTLIPQYILFSKLGWLNTYYPLIVPYFLGSAFFIFLLRQFYLRIPNEMIEAARIDGAGHFYIWWHIMLPLSKPALATVAIFSFNGAWNDFLGPLLYLNDETRYTLQLGLQVFKSEASTQWNLLMTGSLFALLPVILLFFFFQRYFIQGMDLSSGDKG